MDDIINGMAKIFDKISQYEERMDKDIEECLGQLDGMIKNPDASLKQAQKRHKRIVKPMKIEAEESDWPNNLNVSRRLLPRAAKTKGIQKAKISQNMKLKVPVVELELLSDNDIYEYRKSIKSKIKKEKLKSPQPRRVTRASSKEKDLSGNSLNGSNLSGSVQIIPEEDLVITISEEEGAIPEKTVTQKNESSKKKSSPKVEATTRMTRSKVSAEKIENDLVPLEQPEKRVTRSSTKSQKESLSPKANKSSSDANLMSLKDTPENIKKENRKNSPKNTQEEKKTPENSQHMDFNNNENDEENTSSQIIYEDALSKMTIETVPKDQSKPLENSQQQSVNNETYAIATNIPSNATISKPIVDSTFDVPESTFIIDRKLSEGGESNENIAPAGSGATSFGSATETQKNEILNPNLHTDFMKGKDKQKGVPFMDSKILKPNMTAALRTKNTGAIPKVPSKQIKDAGINWKTPSYYVVLNKQCSTSKSQCKETAVPSKYGGKKTPHSAISAKEKQREVDVAVQQENDFLHRLESKRREIEMKEKQRKEKISLQEKYIKTVTQQILERKLQTIHQKQSEEKKAEHDFSLLNSGDSTDEEDRPSKKRPIPPLWSTRKERSAHIESQTSMPDRVIDTFFSTAPLNPNIQEIFPLSINPNLLKRNSSIFWKTPPRYSQLPKY